MHISKKFAGVVAAVVTASLLPTALLVPSAQAANGERFLQVTPEVSQLPLNGVVTLEARLFTDVLGQRSTLIPVLAPVTINFREVVDTPASLSASSCVVAANTTSCSVTASSASPVTSAMFRAWMADSTKDAVEGRLANADLGGQASADCISEAGETDVATCQGSGDTAVAGAAEPDGTDVVKATWLAGGLDVVSDDQRLVPGQPATLTATVYDALGNPAPGIVVKFEFFDVSVSDADGNRPGGSQGGAPDGNCTTATTGPALGTCKVGYSSQVKEGVDLLCAWSSEVAPPFVGNRDNGTCDGEGLVDPSANDGKPSPADDDQDVVRVTWARGTTPPGGTPGGGTGSTTPTGYWLVATDGGIFAFGNADFKGSTGAIKLNQPIVGMAAAPGNKGYWLVASDGGIFAFGDAKFQGSTGAIKLNQPIVGMDATPSGNGYFLVARDGGIFAFGDAKFQGSTGAIKLNQPIVGMTTTPSGNGYWLVASDGGIFAFGDAKFQGSTGAIKLNQPIVGMAAAPSGNGYWLVARDGGIFAFGDAKFQGSTGAIKLNQPIVGMSRNSAGSGYRLVAADGGIFAFGDATFVGSTGAIKLNQPIVGMDGF